MKTVCILLLLLHAARSAQINIAGIDRPKLFAKLYNKALSLRSPSRYYFYMHSMSAQKARKHVGVYMEELNGIPMYITVPPVEVSTLDAEEYNAKNQMGAAEEVVEKIRRKAANRMFQKRTGCGFGLECDRRRCLRACAGLGIGALVGGAVAIMGYAANATIDPAGTSYETYVHSAEHAYDAAVDGIEADFSKNVEAVHCTFEVPKNECIPAGFDGAAAGPEKLSDNYNYVDAAAGAKGGTEVPGGTSYEDPVETGLKDRNISNLAFTLKTYHSEIFEAQMGDAFDALKANLIAADVGASKIEVLHTPESHTHIISFTGENGQPEYQIRFEAESRPNILYQAVVLEKTPGNIQLAIGSHAISEERFFEAITDAGADAERVSMARNAFNDSRNNADNFYLKYRRNANAFYEDVMKKAMFGSAPNYNDPVASPSDVGGASSVVHKSVRDVLGERIEKLPYIKSTFEDLDAALEAKNAAVRDAGAAWNDATRSRYEKYGPVAGGMVATGAAAGAIAGCAKPAPNRGVEEEIAMHR